MLINKLIPPIVKDTYSAYQNYSKDYPDYKTKNLVLDLQEKLKNPKLSPQQRADIAERIAFIERKGKENRKELDMILVTADVVNFVGSCFGPVGAGIAKLTTHAARNSAKQEMKATIVKTTTPAWRRKGKKFKQQSGPQSYMPSVESTKEVATSIIVKMITKPYLPSVKSMVKGTVRYLGSFLPFS